MSAFSGDRPGHGAAAMHEAAARYPEVVRVLDWVALARNKPKWFDEGVHLDAKAGVLAYTRLIRIAYRAGYAQLGTKASAKR
jgi:hypothetical protein